LLALLKRHFLDVTVRLAQAATAVQQFDRWKSESRVGYLHPGQRTLPERQIMSGGPGTPEGPWIVSLIAGLPA